MKRQLSLKENGGNNIKIIIGLIVGVGIGIRLFFVWSNGIVFPRVLSLILDDGYYGATIARNFINGLGVTLDGYSMTNGFQPLWVLFHIPIWLIFGGSSIIPLQVLLTMGIICNLGALYFIIRTVFHFTKSYNTVILVTVLYYFSTKVLSIELSGTESPMVALTFAMMLFYYSTKCIFTGERLWKDGLIMGALLGLLMLSRTDMVFVSVFVLIGMVWFSPTKQTLRLCGLTVAVASIVLLPWLIWNLYQFGSIVQVSGKAGYPMFGRLYDIDLYGSLLSWGVFKAAITRGFVVIMSKKILILFILPLIIYTIQKRKDVNITRILFPLCGVVFVLLFHAVVRYNVKAWYWSAFYPASFIFFTLMLYRTSKQRIVLMLVAGLFLCYSEHLFFSTHSLWMSNTPTRMVLQGLVLRDYGIDRLGGCSIGAISYHSEKSVNNLEGKVNNTAFEYIMNNKLDQYIRESVKYIINYQEILPYRRFMGTDIVGEKTIIENRYDKTDPVLLWKIE